MILYNYIYEAAGVDRPASFGADRGGGGHPMVMVALVLIMITT